MTRGLHRRVTVRCGKILGCGIAERRMRPAVVVVEPPSLDDLAGIGEIEEPVLVE
jgi:hypothetical protein